MRPIQAQIQEPKTLTEALEALLQKPSYSPLSDDALAFCAFVEDMGIELELEYEWIDSDGLLREETYRA